VISIRHGLLAFAVLTSACRSSAPGRAPSPDPGNRPAIPVDRTSAEVTAWIISPVTQENSYTSVTSAALESTDSPISSRDTITSIVRYSLGITRDVKPPAYSARIESISIQGGARTADSTASSNELLPFTLAGRIEPNRITFEPVRPQADPPACSNAAMAVIPIVQRSLVLVPLQLHKGLTWTDSVTSTVCSGPLQTALSTVRTYLVQGQAVINGRTVILLEQQSRTSFAGEGAQQQHRIRVRGSGSGKGQLAVDAETGALIEAAADHVTALTITSSGRDQRFTQTSRERVTRTR
jgi:hypothetical protein